MDKEKPATISVNLPDAATKRAARSIAALAGQSLRTWGGAIIAQVVRRATAKGVRR